MKIGIVADLRQPINPDSYGYSYGIYQLSKGLAKKGHQVTLFAGRGSKCPRVKIISPDLASIDPLVENVLNAYGESFNFDIINVQLDHFGAKYDNLSKCPVLRTVTYGAHKGAHLQELKKYKNKLYSAISMGLTKTYPFLNWQGVVYRAIDISDFEYFSKPKDYLIALSRIMPEKGIHLSIEAAKKSKSRLIIVGGAFDPDYFRYEIKPHLNEKIKYAGEITDRKKKVRLLGGARALIFTPTEEEGFGNIILESMATGTPVIALNRGAAKEIVVHNVTGFLCKNLEEVVASISKVDQIDRKACRDHVEKKFPINIMIERYEQLYMKVIKRGRKSS